MENISSSNSQKELVPRLRFQGYEGSWQTATMGELGSFTKGAPLSKADISESGTPFVLYGELYTTYKEVAYNTVRFTTRTASDEHYSRIGDVIVPTSGETPEEIATATCVMKPGVILAGDLCIFRTQIIDGRLVSYAINHVVNSDISRVAQGKSVVHVKPDELAKIQIRFPGGEEQQKILRFLELLDRKTETQRLLIESLKSYKRGVSNTLFPPILCTSTEGENRGLKWSSLTFGDVFTLINNNTLSRAELNYTEGKLKNIHYGDVLIKYSATLDPASPMVPFINEGVRMNYSRIEPLRAGDVIIADTAEDLTVGKATEIARSEVQCVAGLHTIACRPRLSFASGYLGYYFNSELYHNQLTPLIQGTKVSSISRSAIAGTRIYFPPFEEQAKIASTLSLIDCRIDVEERRCEKLIEYKKALLQRLFI